MDTFREVAAPRLVDFHIEDMRNTYIVDRNHNPTHWLSGMYRPLALSHNIDSKGGYTTEFKLLKYYGL